MQEIRWLEPLPNNNLDGGLRLLQELKWNLIIEEADSIWFVRAGHIKLLTSDSREAVDAFIYGLSLAYSVMPKAILEQFQSVMIQSTE